MKDILKEFKDFISKGNVLDMAVGVIIGSAFGKIVSSLVDNIIMPLIGIIIGGHNFSSLTIRVKDATIYYGAFIQSIVDFLIVAACIFFVIKTVNKLQNLKKKEEKKEEAKEEKAVETKTVKKTTSTKKKSTKKKSTKK